MRIVVFRYVHCKFSTFNCFTDSIHQSDMVIFRVQKSDFPLFELFLIKYSYIHETLCLFLEFLQISKKEILNNHDEDL